MRIGSLFSGAAGLDRAVQAVFGGEVVWHCELDPAASKVLAHRYPGVPNYHDITTTDWSQVAPVDIITAGWPCQPFSLAGKRKGAEDERALWPYVAGAVRMVRPRIICLENVSAVLGPEFQRVANDLAALGYDIAWTCLRASNVGAPHRRERVFIVAHTEGIGRGIRDTTHHRQADREIHAPTDDRGAVADCSCDGRDERRTQPTRFVGGSDAAVSGDGPLIPTPRASDAGPRGGTTGWGMRNWVRDELLPTPRSSRGASTTETSYALGGERSDNNRRQGEVLLPTPRAADGNGGGNYNSPGHQDTLPGTVRLLPTPRKSDGDGGNNPLTSPERQDDVGTAIARLAGVWGKYESAIRRWESVTRPAPSPTEPNSKGNPRLSAAFSEWMLGWPAGWVTQVPGISRNDQLRIIGNGVVVLQAEAALRWLLSIEVAA